MKTKTEKLASVRAYYWRNRDKILEHHRQYRLRNLKAVRTRNLSYYYRVKRLSPPKTCEVCGSGGKICRDHDHGSGMFRGWLCNNCNTSLGLLKDNSTRLRALADYLDRVQQLAH